MTDGGGGGGESRDIIFTESTATSRKGGGFGSAALNGEKASLKNPTLSSAKFELGEQLKGERNFWEKTGDFFVDLGRETVGFLSNTLETFEAFTDSLVIEGGVGFGFGVEADVCEVVSIEALAYLNILHIKFSSIPNESFIGLKGGSAMSIGALSMTVSHNPIEQYQPYGGEIVVKENFQSSFVGFSASLYVGIGASFSIGVDDYFFKRLKEIWGN